MKILVHIITIAVLIYMLFTIGSNHPPKNSTEWLKFIGTGIFVSAVAYLPLMGLSYFALFMLIVLFDDEGAGCGCLLFLIFGFKLLEWLFGVGTYAFSSTSSWFQWLFSYF